MRGGRSCKCRLQKAQVVFHVKEALSAQVYHMPAFIFFFFFFCTCVETIGKSATWFADSAANVILISSHRGHIEEEGHFTEEYTMKHNPP